MFNPFSKLKNLLVSRTIRAGLGTVIASLAGIAGVTLTDVDVDEWMMVSMLAFTTISGIVATAGRVFAGGPIALASLPGVIVPILKAINVLMKQHSSLSAPASKKK